MYYSVFRKLLAIYYNMPYHTANVSQKSLQRFFLMSSIYTVVYEHLDETSLVEIKVKIQQVINILIYFLEKICQVNWYRTNKKG